MVKKTYIYKGTKVWFSKNTYKHGGSMQLQMWCEDGPYATLTVNLSNGCAGKNLAYVDANNYPWAPKFLEENGIAENTGIIGYSGYCSYPLYTFNMNKI